MTDAKARLLQMIADEAHMAGGGLLKAVGKAQKVAKAAQPAKAATKIIEAPSIVIPSRLSNLKEVVRGQKGEYGAKRVERAADEIPNLERMYKEEAMRDAFLGENAKALVTMNPADFEKYALTLEKRTTIGPKMAELAKQGEIDKYTLPTDKYIQYLMSLQDGFEHMPYLDIFKDEVGLPMAPKVTGHEGRHRSRALAERGEPSSLVKINPRGDLREGLPRRSQEEYIDALRQELELKNRMIRPEDDTDFVQFPDVYAAGGAVHMAGGGRTPKYPWERYEQPKKVAEMRARKINPVAGAIKSGADYATQLIDKGPSLSNLVGGLVGAVPFVGPDMRKRMEASEISIPTDFNLASNMPAEDYEYGQPMRYRTPGITTTSVPTKDVLEAIKMSDLVGTPGLSKVAEDIGYGQMPDAFDMLDAASVAALGYGAVKAGAKAGSAAAGAAKKATQALTPSKITPLETGATYATKQEGPFFRVSPTALDTSKATTRGIKEADGLRGSALDGGGAEQAGREVPKFLSSEEVGRIIADPVANEPLNIAKKYTRDTQGADFGVPQVPSSSLAKQSGIARTFDLAVQGSPEYKSAIFGAYGREMPELMERIGAKNYDDLMEKAYRQMAKETDDQFKRLPYNFSYHRAGEGNYNGAKDMASDVHGNKHLYVYQGGDKHDFLHNVDPQSGLNENEKFRAVHDLLGHAIYGNEFGPKGEEMAWAVHQQMYSPLARMAMTAETRGQNSVVNYSPLNAKLKQTISEYERLGNEASRRGDKALVNKIAELKRQAYSGLEFAPNRAVLLPPEFMNPQFAGGIPDYLAAANKPMPGTSIQSPLTHFSNEPGLTFTDPRMYGTGIKGAEAERLAEPGAVRDRSYFYMGEPGSVLPEPGLGVNRYRGESSNLYDITQDPLNFNVLARESNRTPYTAKYNQGIAYPAQDANDIERLVREYGYEGMANPKASKPMAIMFDKTPVQRRKKGGEVHMAAGGSVSDAKKRLLNMIYEEPHMGGGGVIGAIGKARKIAKAAEAAKAAKAAKVDHPLVFPRAAAKTIDDIRPIAQRMAQQMTGEFVKQNPKVTTNPAGKSRKQFERERSIPLETRNVVPERPAPDVNYEDYMGYGLVGVPGDPTMGGVAKRGSLEQLTQPTVELTRVGDITPDYPVPLFGGPRFGDDEKFWASNFGAAVPIQKNASKLADEYQSPVIAKYIKMGSGSENFALHNLDALLSIQRPEKLNKAKMSQLTEAIQAGSPKYGKFPGFTGFKDPADVLLQAQMDSNLRKHIAETLTKPTITDQLGLPNGLDVVAAITYPELRNLETGASGFSVGKMKPGATLQRGQSSHPTYDTDIPGSFLGRSRYPTPYEIAFPDTTAYARSQMTPGVQEFNMMKMLGPRERIDQQYIDEMKMYEQLMKQYTGKKKGGLARTKKVKRHGNTVSN
jgi:hypothetical protein